MNRPVEAIVNALYQQWEAYRQIRTNLAFIRETNPSHELDPDGSLTERSYELVLSTRDEINKLLPDLYEERRNYVQAERQKDKWASPSCRDGWLCPDSPQGVCAYEDPENLNPDCCDYCGFPDERK